VGDSFITINWYIATKIFLYQLLKFSSLNDSSIFGVSGYFSDLSSVNHMNQFFNKLGTNIYINDFLNLSSDFRSDFSLDSTIVSLENKNTFVFVCFNPRLECPLLNTRLRRILNLKGNLSIFSIGLVNQYVNLPIHNIGNKISDAINMLKGKLTANVSIFNRMQTITTNVFACSNKLMSIAVIFGISSGHVLKTKPLFINFASKHFVNYCVGVIPPYVGHVNYFELINIRDNSLYLSNNVFAYLHKVDEKLILDSICRKNNYIVYNGSHFDISVKYCNLFLPSFTHLEESQDFINLEGKRFISNKVKSLSNEVLTTQELFRLLNIINNKSMKANFHVGLISGKILSYFDFLKLDFNCLEIYNNRNTSIGSCLGIHDKPSNMVLQDNIFSSFIYNYYKTDFICRTSKNLTLASTEYLRNLNNF